MKEYLILKVNNFLLFKKRKNSPLMPVPKFILIDFLMYEFPLHQLYRENLISHLYEECYRELKLVVLNGFNTESRDDLFERIESLLKEWNFIRDETMIEDTVKEGGCRHRYSFGRNKGSTCDLPRAEGSIYCKYHFDPKVPETGCQNYILTHKLKRCENANLEGKDFCPSCIKYYPDQDVTSIDAIVIDESKGLYREAKKGIILKMEPDGQVGAIGIRIVDGVSSALDEECQEYCKQIGIKLQ